MKRKELWQIFASVTAGILFALIILEIFFYVSPESLPPNVRFSFVTNFDSELRQSFKPNVNVQMQLQDGDKFYIKTINLGTNIGFRDNGLNFGKTYAVVVGDSFIYGHGVELNQVWTEILESRLKENVINMGMPSAYPETESLIYQRYGGNFKPKVVILGVFQNDFADAYIFNYNEKDFGYSYLKRKLDSLSSVYRLLRFAVNTEKFGEYKNYPHFVVGNSSYIIDTFLAGPVVDKNKPEIVIGENITKRSILELKRIVEAGGSQFVLVIFPSKEQVFWDIVKEEINATYDIDSFNKDIIKFSEENEIKYIDLTPKFREVSKMEPNLFFQIDGHMNAKGNRLAEESVYNYLLEKGFLD